MGVGFHGEGLHFSDLQFIPGSNFGGSEVWRLYRPLLCSGVKGFGVEDRKARSEPEDMRAGVGRKVGVVLGQEL